MVGAALAMSFVVAYGLFSKYLAKTPITGPMLFVVLGVLAGPEALNVVSLPLTDDFVQTVLEMTLVIVLFTDAAVIDVAAVRRHLTIPTRLLTVGLIGTMAAGIALAAAMFGELGFWGAAVVAVTLAPTDAALGQAVVTNDMVPGAVRQGLSVESGLNDGIAVPFLSIAIAGVAGEMTTGTGLVSLFLEELGGGFFSTGPCICDGRLEPGETPVVRVSSVVGRIHANYTALARAAGIRSPAVEDFYSWS